MSSRQQGRIGPHLQSGWNNILRPMTSIRRRNESYLLERMLGSDLSAVENFCGSGEANGEVIWGARCP